MRAAQSTAQHNPEFAFGRRVLVIDDDPQIRKLLRLMLQGEGYEVIEAGGGEAAVDLCRRQSCDLVITDIRMPGKDGLETICELRKQFPRLRLIAMSGDGQDRLLAAQDAGADLAISKPFSRLGLSNVVHRAMRLPPWRAVRAGFDACMPLAKAS